MMFELGKWRNVFPWIGQITNHFISVFESHLTRSRFEEMDVKLLVIPCVTVMHLRTFTTCYTGTQGEGHLRTCMS